MAEDEPGPCEDHSVYFPAEDAKAVIDGILRVEKRSKAGPPNRSRPAHLYYAHDPHLNHRCGLRGDRRNPDIKCWR